MKMNDGIYYVNCNKCGCTMPENMAYYRNGYYWCGMCWDEEFENEEDDEEIKV